MLVDDPAAPSQRQPPVQINHGREAMGTTAPLGGGGDLTAAPWASGARLPGRRRPATPCNGSAGEGRNIQGMLRHGPLPHVGCGCWPVLPAWPAGHQQASGRGLALPRRRRMSALSAPTPGSGTLRGERSRRPASPRAYPVRCPPALAPPWASKEGRASEDLPELLRRPCQFNLWKVPGRPASSDVRSRSPVSLRGKKATMPPAKAESP